MMVAALALLALAVLALPTAPAAAAGGGYEPTAKDGDPPAYAARLALCRRSLRAEKRTAVVAATMRPIPDAEHFAVKVDLYERPLGARGPWALRTDVPGLGEWMEPDDPTLGSRGADVYKYRQAVGRLVVGYAYRFKVGFRWLDEERKIVREATATTRRCRQPDLRPDLALALVRAKPSQRLPGLVRYVVRVRNDGRTAAKGVVVAATLPGDEQGRTARVGRLAAGEEADVAFTGPGCEAGEPQPPSFHADPANAVDEVDEADNTLVLVCPVPA
jgi:uncharacterized repeat protein (TIGR01451 family)